MLTSFLFLIAAAAANPPRLDACQLLSARDLQTVQGEAFRTRKLTDTEANGLKVSQCFYALPSYANSVSVDLMRGDARGFWRSHFADAEDARDDDDDRDHDADRAPAKARNEREEEERVAKVRRIRGLGDAAVWSGNRVAGALYVLKGDTIVRVSVGGAGSEEQKIARSKKLAAKALRKL